jgi:anti-sigma factor RsiW
MAETHIIELLEEKPFSSLSPADIGRAESHIESCDECKSAYSAARIAALLIEARASETVEVGPFFKTRVMAAIRERRLSAEEPALVRMWRAASALVSTMGILLVILTGITIFSPGPNSQMPATDVVASQNLYSPEYVVLDGGDPGDVELANDQVIPTMYDLEDGDGQ